MLCNDDEILYVYLDESGAMHLKNERFFLIGGFISKKRINEKAIQKRFEKRLKENLKLSKEIKSSLVGYEHRVKLIEKIEEKEIQSISIVIDKNNSKCLLIKTDENIMFNFFIGILYQKLLEMGYSKISFRLDSRSTKIQNLNSLEDYLKLIFINKYQNSNFFVEVRYINSERDFCIRMADFIANHFWNVFNKNKDCLLLKKHHIKLKFPEQ